MKKTVNKGRLTGRHALAAAAFAASVCAVWPGRAAFAAPSAASSVSMRVGVGFQNYFDPSLWTPVRVVIRRRGGAPASAVLVFAMGKQLPFSGRLKWPVTLPKGGATASITVGVPGTFLQKGGVLELESGGRTLAEARLTGVAVGGADLAGVVSDQPQTVQFLAGVSSESGQSPLVSAYIPPDTLPSSAELLQGLTYLYLDGRAAGELSPSQSKAVLTWVRAGGVLILGGIQPNAGQLGPFTAVSPVQGTIVLDQPGTVLGRFAGTPGPRGDLALLYGMPGKGTTGWIGSGGQVVLGSRPYGRGQVVYAGFNAASPALVSWSGNAMLWDQLLQTLRTRVLPAKFDLFGTNGYFGLMNAAELFPQLHAPPLWIWEIVFGLYVFSVGPAIYLILRRRRKNEWAWIVLPAVSFAVAGGIYAAGLLQRPGGILTQSVGFVDIVDDKLAETVGVEAMMSPHTRSYSLVLPNGAWVVPLAERLTGLVKDGTVTYAGGRTAVSFSGVRAWGGRFAYAVRMTRDFGAIRGELYQADGSLAGYLMNRTSVNFADVALVADGRVVALGPLRQGESVQVEAMLRRASPGAFAANLSGALPSASYGVGRALLDYVRTYAAARTPPGTVMAIAWTHNQPRLFDAQGAVLSATPQWVVRQLIPVTPVFE